MNQDILFKTEDFVFSFRVGGVLRRGDTVLLQCPRGTRDYAIIGGHICAMETASETLVREFREELHAEVEVGDLLCVAENFFPWGSKPCHQICFYYEVQLKDHSIPLEGTFQGYDDLDNQRYDLDFCWIPVKAIEEGVTVYPVGIAPYLIRNDLKNGYLLSRRFD